MKVRKKAKLDKCRKKAKRKIKVKEKERISNEKSEWKKNKMKKCGSWEKTI